jgi:glycosyltransferase involved in cell wall biosynthesis
LIVADNASTDNSISFLAAHYPDIQIIRLQQNFGFAKGYNEALKQVEADYYVLLNSDVEVTPDWLQPMIELLEKDSAYAACQPKILAFKQKSLFEYAGAAGGWIDAFGYPFARGRVFDICEKDSEQYNSTQLVFWASGAALVIKRSVFQKAGGFDEFFFAHQEEMTCAGDYNCSATRFFAARSGGVPRWRRHAAARQLAQNVLKFRNNLIMLAKNLHPQRAVVENTRSGCCWINYRH